MNTLSHREDYAQAIKYLKLVLPEMNRLKVPVTPNNYYVWYEYATGKNPALIEKIDKLKSCNQTFSSQINDDLYDLFIQKPNSSPLSQLNINVKSVIDNLLERIHRQETVHDTYSQSLSELAKEVESISQMADIERLIQKLLAEAHLKNVENIAFQKQISDMSSQVENLDKKLRRLAIDANTDSLTGIPNRRALNITLRKHLEGNGKFSLILIDIDRFKLLNDTYGHLTGDRVLRYVAQLVSKNIKGSDYFARFGGEEFVLLLPNTNINNARCVADNIRSVLAKQKLYDSSEDKRIGKLTLSMGVTSRLANDTIELILKRADQCLYEAKNSGRNKVVCDKVRALSDSLET